MKTCSKCKTEKPLTEFYNNSNAKDGLQTRCKRCTIDTASQNYKNYYQNNKDKFKKYTKKSQNTNGAGVYEIYENEISLYIGAATSLNRRIWNHKSYIKNPSSAQPSVAYLYPLLQRHNCEFRILEVCDEKEIFEKEKQYIKQLTPKYNTYGF